MRDLRLLSLQTNPYSFSSRFEVVVRQPLDYYSNKIANWSTSDVFGYYGSFADEALTELVGYTYLNNHPNSNYDHIGFIYEVYIHPDYRRRHRATHLLGTIINLVESRISELNLDFIRLYVNQENDSAQKLYRQLGFTPIACIPKALKFNDEYFNQILYQYSLKA